MNDLSMNINNRISIFGNQHYRNMINHESTPEQSQQVKLTLTTHIQRDVFRESRKGFHQQNLECNGSTHISIYNNEYK